VFEFCSDMSEAFLLPGLFFPMTKPADNNKKKVPAWTCSAIFHKLIRIRKPNHSYEIEGIKEQPSLNPKLVWFLLICEIKSMQKKSQKPSCFRSIDNETNMPEPSSWLI
jgi:hypothetical protein